MKINQELCSGCGLCAENCINACVALQDGYPVVDEDRCTGCGICANNCPCGAIDMEQEQSSGGGVDLSAYQGAWVVVEIEAGAMNGASLELLSKARELADKRNADVTAVVIANSMSDTTIDRIAATGCDKILQIKNSRLASYDTGLYAELAEQAIKQYHPEIVLLPATSRGRDLAPTIASKLSTGLTADCTGLDIDQEGNLLQTRPTYGGNIMASIVTTRHRPQMATVRPKVMQIVNRERKEGFHIEEMEYTVDYDAGLCKMIEKIEKEFPVSDVSEANVIVAGGYGMQSDENFKWIYRLAAKMNGAAAATRKAVDEGWAPMEIQIGQTGKTAAPDLYLAFGISGALQHFIGIKEAKKIIAVNNDPLAPIFSYCDVAILGDAAEIAEALCKKLDGR